MPTGYTTQLMEKGQSFEDFVMLCARAMGACVMMRDDPMDAPIPKFEPAPYYSEEIAKAELKLKTLRAMTPAQRLEHGEKLKAEFIQSRVEWLTKELAENERIDSMATAVSAWTPPTEDHTGLKEFMLEQLRISRHDTDYIKQYLNDADAKPAKQFYDEDLGQAIRDVAYYRKEMEAEITRTNSRNEWVEQLRENLKGGKK